MTEGPKNFIKLWEMTNHRKLRKQRLAQKMKYITQNYKKTKL